MDHSWMFKPKDVKDFVEQHIPADAVEHVDDNKGWQSFMWESRVGGIVYKIVNASQSYMDFPQPRLDNPFLHDVTFSLTHHARGPLVILKPQVPSVRFLTPDGLNHSIDFANAYAPRGEDAWLKVQPFVAAQALLRADLLNLNTESPQ